MSITVAEATPKLLWVFDPEALPKGALGFETHPQLDFFSPMLHEASHFLAAIHLPDLIDQPLRNTVCEFLPMCNIFGILDNFSDQSQAIG